MILDNVIEKVSDMCCADLPKDGTAKPASAKDGSDDVLDEKKEEVDEKPVVESGKRAMSIPSTLFTGKETKFELLVWTDLPADAKKAAETLGFDEEKWNPDTDSHPETEWKPWHKLSDAEKEAAETLGWDEAAWEHKYEETSFADIPDHVKRAAESLGFDQKMWDEDGWPETKHKNWNDLTADEKAAYAVFGYTRGTWD